MEEYIYSKSIQILEKIANSVHEREPKSKNPLFFSHNEVQVVQDWLLHLICELTEKPLGGER